MGTTWTCSENWRDNRNVDEACCQLSRALPFAYLCRAASCLCFWIASNKIPFSGLGETFRESVPHEIYPECIHRPKLSFFMPGWLYVAHFFISYNPFFSRCVVSPACLHVCSSFSVVQLSFVHRSGQNLTWHASVSQILVDFISHIRGGERAKGNCRKGRL